MMIYYIFTFFIILLSFNKVKSAYTIYKNFKSIIDPENKKNCCTLFYDLCKFGYTIFSIKKVEKFNNKHIKIPYEYKENKYVFLVKVPKGIMPIDYIKDENGVDVYEDILPYLGPNLDCHGCDVFPRDFGLKKISIKDINDKYYTFEENEKIVLK